MTPTDLRRTGERLFGPRWQTPLARLAGVSDRQVRRWASGIASVPAGVAALVSRILGRDEWLIAASAEGEREYLIHAWFPAFRARIVDEIFDAGEYDLHGLTYVAGEDAILAEFVWYDRIPGEPELRALLKRGAAALASFHEN